eukprot:scaffold14886_cov108-Cylindrotheca_fusiformis.AAC.5
MTNLQREHCLSSSLSIFGLFESDQGIAMSSQDESRRRTSDAGRSRKRQRSGRYTSNDPNYFLYTRTTKSVDIPRSSMTHLRVDSGVERLTACLFQGCTKLVNVQLPETLHSIGDYAFAGCSNLKRLRFVWKDGSPMPSSDRSFDDSSIVLPRIKGIFFIGSGAFSCCTSLRKLTVCWPPGLLQNAAFYGCTGLTSVELPEVLPAIDDCLFQGCESLVSIKMPSDLLAIFSEAFRGCKSLVSLELPDELHTIRSHAFRECVSLESLVIPDTVVLIGKLAFMGCSALKHIRLSSSLKIIEDGVFEDCSSLECIEIPRKVTRIKEFAFSGCSTLSHLRIPPGVRVIEQYAFNNCKSLLSLELPEGLKTTQYVSPEEEEEMDFEADECEEELFPCRDPELEEDLIPNRDPIFDSASPSSGGFFGIYGCSSLVNLVIPENQECDESEYGDHTTEETFRNNLMFGRVLLEEDDDLADSLKSRFFGLPLHRLCYYQSYHPPSRTMGQLQRLLDADPMAAAKVDTFGMTPLHVLALSHTPNQDMLLALLQENPSPLQFIRTRDSFGSTPMHYLCRSRMPNSSSVIRRLFQHIVCRTRWLDPWQSKVLIAIGHALCMDWYSRKKGIERILFQIAIYERVETLSLLELSLWKAKMIRISSNRQACRVGSGASVVISNVLPFLDKLDPRDYECTHQSAGGGAHAPPSTAGAAAQDPCRLTSTLSILDYFLPVNP